MLQLAISTAVNQINHLPNLNKAFKLKICRLFIVEIIWYPAVVSYRTGIDKAERTSSLIPCNYVLSWQNIEHRNISV